MQAGTRSFADEDADRKKKKKEKSVGERVGAPEAQPRFVMENTERGKKTSVTTKAVIKPDVLNAFKEDIAGDQSEVQKTKRNKKSNSVFPIRGL